ncbi:MAG: PD-(D/E)XK nuclease family transposase, partial [Verrucomicrobiota bacterium]
ELQKAKQKFFKDRSIFYSTFPIQEQAKRGDWDFELKAVYTVAILDFCFDDSYGDDGMVELPSPRPYLHRVKLTEQSTREVFYDKLTFVYLEMPRFEMSESEVMAAGDFEKWMYLLKNLGTLERIPEWAQREVFLKFLDEAEIAEFDLKEREDYESSLKYYRDMTNVINTASEEAREEGREEGLEAGLEKGREEGEIMGLKKTAVLLAESKFCNLSEDDRNRIESLTADQLKRLVVELVSIESLEALGFWLGDQ